MIKHYCDICGKELKGLSAFLLIDNHQRFKNGFSGEICQDCYDKIYNFVKDLKEDK